MNELVSIIVPIYNVETYLSKCIDSLINQTYENLEIILVNDGSTDRSGDIASNYAKKDARIRYVEQENQGQGSARNHGIKLAQGTYLSFVDSDDSIDKKMIEKMVRKMEIKDLDIVVCSYERFNEYGKAIERYDNPLDPQLVYDPFKNQEVILIDPVPWNKLFKKELFEDLQIWFPSRVWYEDLRTVPKLLANAKRVGVIKEPLYHYLQREGSTMTSNNLVRQEESLYALDDLINYFISNHLNKKFEKEIEFLCISHVFVFGINRIVRIPHSQDMIEKFREYLIVHFPDYEQNPYIQINFSSKELKFYRWINKKQYWKIRTGSKIKKEIKKWKKH